MVGTSGYAVNHMATVAELEAKVQALAALPSPQGRRALRLAAGVSIAEVAAVVGVSRQAVNAWERGTAKPVGDHLHAYLELLAMFKRTVGA
jgi:DNA-binding transcriptional regulator YiaG